MASIAQLVSEIAHSVGKPNSKPLRENIKLLILQTRNEVIRRSYENHSYVDKGLTQRFRVSIIDVLDGDINIPEGIDTSDLTRIKRTEHLVPRPVRLTNNLPFDRVSTVGFESNKEIPFIKETTARFSTAVPGLSGMHRYDYINGYIYIFPLCGKPINFDKIIIESAFEHPNHIDIENGVTTEFDVMMDENEYLLSEDMIGQIKEIIYKRDLLQNIRETNEHSINTDVI